MSQLSNIDKVALTSTYPTDKIVAVFTGSFVASGAENVADSLGANVYKQLRITHGFTRPVFTRLKWSKDQTTWIDGGTGQSTAFPLVYCITVSSSSEIRLMTTELIDRIYYEIVCFWIDDYDATNPLVPAYADTTKPLAFDSRLNYQKVFSQGQLTVSGTSATTSVIHNLGYAPNAWIYFESLGGEVWPAIAGGVDNVWLYQFNVQGEITFNITSSVINFVWNAGVSFSGNARIWYRIYLND